MLLILYLVVLTPTPTEKKISSNKPKNNVLVRSSVLKRVDNDEHSTPGTLANSDTCETENNENITLNVRRVLLIFYYEYSF